MAAPRPRTAVIDQAWRNMVSATATRVEGDPFAVLSGRDGQPLARTVKCLIDPLVLRLRANPELGRPLLDVASVAEVGRLISLAAPTIADTARWFTELKYQRRAAAITGGNIQEQYFPRAFELAVSYGAPGNDAASIAAEMIAEIHQSSAGMSVADLTAYLDENHAELDERLNRIWGAGERGSDAEPDLCIAEVLAALLTDDVSASDRDGRWATLTASAVPAQIGLRLFDSGAPVDQLLLSCGVEIMKSARRLSLSEFAPATIPVLRGRGGDRPLDRSIATRVTTTLRRSRDRDELPSIGELVGQEISRSRQPWALDGAVWHAALLVGVVVAAQLHPLAPQPSSHHFVQAMSQRLAAQAHIMYNRRFLLEGSAANSALAADLLEFWRPYLNRLWVRLHGWSVVGPDTATTEFDADSLLDLLDGIARSVSFDQRSRIRATIEKSAR
ncbi:hypothetical protein [Gordonia sp. CPCC 205333]|uniref:hypothetical protein n=1 Tax=Gordonia sp. CPCC 205333 TaxID=3140790 RepID=UPI003AF3997B